MTNIVDDSLPHNPIRTRMIKSAFIGGLLFILLFGFNIYAVDRNFFSRTGWLESDLNFLAVIGWGCICFMSGLIFGIVACIPTNDGNYFIRLIQAALRGMSRGLLVGISIQLFIVIGGIIVTNGSTLVTIYPGETSFLIGTLQPLVTIAFFGALLGLLHGGLMTRA